MENHILHFSSPKQNNDFIVYHNRAKSTLGGSQTTRLKAKIMVPESARDCNTKRTRPDRHGVAASSDFTTPAHGYPLHNRINIVKELLETSEPSSTSRRSFEVDMENQRKLTELEDENRELKKRLKARDVRITYLVQENEVAREKIEKINHLESQNQLYQNENKSLKTDLENFSKRIKELETEKAYMSERHSTQKSSNEEIARSLSKYTKYIINALEHMESNTVALFYFEERFSGERQLSKLIRSKDYGTIALNSFRYISDLLAHVIALAQPKREPKKIQVTNKNMKEHRVQPSEPSSICLSPLRNDSRENTPRSLVREMEGRGVPLEGFDRVQEGRSNSPYKTTRSAEGRKLQQDLAKKCLTTRESRPNGMLRGSSDGVGQLIRKKNAVQAGSGRIQKSGTASYAQMHGRGDSGRVRTRESNEREVLMSEISKQPVKRREDEEKERYMLGAGKKRDMRYRETEEDEIEKIKAGLREENVNRRRNEEEDMETYASLGVNIKNFAEGQFGRRTKEHERNERDNVSVDRDEEDEGHAINVKALLRQGLGIQDVEERVETRGEEGRKDCGREKVYSKVRGDREENRMRRVAGRCSEENDADKLSKLLSHGSDTEEKQEDYGMKARKVYQSERVEDANRGHFQTNREMLRTYSVQHMNAGNEESPRSPDKNAERFVTFDGTDGHSLFASDKKDPGSAHKMKRGTHKASESEYYSVSTRNDHAQYNHNHHQRYSSDVHSGGLVEAVMRKRIDQDGKNQEMSYGMSGESRRGKAGRGDFNS